MSERRVILDQFEDQTVFLNETVPAGIEFNRKGLSQIRVTDAEGNPITDAKVHASQKTHAFKYGANLFMLDELETEEKNELYKEHMSKFCNMATLPFYWDATEPEEGKTRYAKDSVRFYRRPAIDLCMEFCEKHGIEPREHALAYENFFPKWLYDADVFTIKKALERRFREISERYGDRIRTIEVTNEMEWVKGKTAFYTEPDYIEWCFKLAEKYFPGNQLVINEHTSAAWADRCNPYDKYYSYIKAAMQAGARIDAIGMQYHMFNRREAEYEKTRNAYNPEGLYRHMDLYAQFGKPLQVTEVTVPAYSNDPEDEAIQAEILDKLYRIWFSHPAMEQIIYWNMVDGYAYVKSTDPVKIRESMGNMSLGENYYYGGLLRFDMSPKPAYYTIRNLFEKEWHTDTVVGTNERGVAAFRGFYGKYDVEIVANGQTLTREINLQKGKKNVFEIVV